MSQDSTPPKEGDRCCGQCDAALGGCLKGLVLPFHRRVLGFLNLGKLKVPAGRSQYASHGTPPLVVRGGAWVREEDAPTPRPPYR